VQPIEDLKQPVAAPAHPARRLQAEFRAARVEVVGVAGKRGDDTVEDHPSPVAVRCRQTARGVHATRDVAKLGILSPEQRGDRREVRHLARNLHHAHRYHATPAILFVSDLW